MLCVPPLQIVAPVGWVDMVGSGTTFHDTNVLNVVGESQPAWQLALRACMILAAPATAAKEGMVVLSVDQEVPPLVE